MSEIIAKIRKSRKAGLALVMLICMGSLLALYSVFANGPDSGANGINMVDTDGDGFPDATDANPVSRANLKWGNLSCLTTNGDYDVRTGQPAWLLAAYQNGGLWNTNPPTGWYVPPETDNDTGWLSIMGTCLYAAAWYT